jgi:hypothetical protein
VNHFAQMTYRFTYAAVQRYSGIESEVIEVPGPRRKNAAGENVYPGGECLFE